MIVDGDPSLSSPKKTTAFPSKYDPGRLPCTGLRVIRKFSVPENYGLPVSASRKL